MKLGPSHPCHGCPWSPNTPGYLHPGRAQEVADQALYSDGQFLCHKTVEHDDDGEHVPNLGNRLCAGYAIAALRDGVPGQMMRIEARLRFAPDYPDDPEHELVFDPDEMVNHHERAWAKARR